TGLSVYAENYDVVAGPVSLVVTRLLGSLGGYDTAVVLGSVLGLVLIWSIERLVDPSPEAHAATLMGGALFLMGWIDMVTYGHIDDALVCVCAVAAVWGVSANRPLIVGCALGIAIATKPWAVTLVPLVLALNARGKIKAIGAAVALGVAAW